jgi:hypothetical protein
LQFPTTEAEIIQALTPTPASKRQRKGFGGYVEMRRQEFFLLIGLEKF